MESIAEIKKVFADADISEYSGLIEKYGDDDGGRQSLLYVIYRSDFYENLKY